MQKYPEIQSRGVIAACICALYLVLSASLVFTQKPDVDEGWFTSPAWTLASKGYMGTAVVQESIFKGGRDLTGINHRTYWIMPLQVIGEAGWLKVVGLGVAQMRFWSVMWGLVALVSWWRIALILLESELLAIVAAGMIAIDYTFVRVAAQGRMDMMCAALGLTGVALYLHFRERNLGLALMAGHCGIAAAIFTHPNGILYLFGILVCTAVLDFRRLRFTHVIIAGLPYLVACGAWGAYIMEAPDLFRRQFSGNAASRLDGLFTPMASLRAEIRDRYLGLGAGSQHLLKIVSVLPYLMGLGGAFAIPRVRRNPACRILLIWACGCFVYFWLFESTRLFLYVVHIAPICLVLLAACGGTLIWEGSLPKWIAVAGLAAFVAIQLGGCFVVARRNTMSPFMAAVHVLEPHIQRGELVMASAEYGIPMQYPDNLIDDQRLGCQTGKRADWIVLGFRYTSWFDWAKEHEPDTYSCVSQLLDQSYQTVFQDAGIRVERRLVTVPAR